MPGRSSPSGNASSGGPASVGVVIVTYRSRDTLPALLDALAKQRTPGDRVVVVDNASGDGSAEYARARTDAVDEVVANHGNIGFAEAANVGGDHVTEDVVLLLNPDAIPQPGFMDAIRRAPADWTAWMGLVLLPDGRVNTAGNAAHYLGFGWAGRFGVDPEAISSRPEPVGFLSGACMAVRSDTWQALGGFPPEFFMYLEDTDLSHRLRLRGLRFGIVPNARVIHDYEFEKGGAKWRHLERNRWLTVLRTYPGPLLVTVLPAMILLEPLMLLVALRGGWLGQKVRAMGGVLAALPRVLQERRSIQGARTIDAITFADGLVPDLDSPFLGSIGQSSLVRLMLRSYWRFARAVARAMGGGGGE